MGYDFNTMQFSHPDRPAPKSGSTTKRINQMTTAEIRDKANRDAVEYWRQALSQDPTNETLQAEYRNACYAINVDPDAAVERLRSMDKEKLVQEWAVKGKAVVDAELEKFREGQAEIWMASQPRYVATPANATQLINRLNAMGLRGSVNELNIVFEQLESEGLIKAPPVAVPLYSTEELRQMSAADCKTALEQMGINTQTF